MLYQEEQFIIPFKKQKIHILGAPRSGTTSLYEALRDNINYSMGLFEPVNPLWNYKIISKLKALPHLSLINSCNINIIEKNVIIFPNISPINSFDITLTFYKNYLQQFDKLIFLLRKDLKELAKSTQIAVMTDNWHTPYKNIEVDYKDLLPLVEMKNEITTQLASHFNVPLLYYEDLYSNNLDYINNFLDYYNLKLNNLPNFYSKLHPKNRLQK